jgi:hypothetical protein
MNSLQPKNPLVSAPIGINTSQISMPENSHRNELRVTAFWLFIASQEAAEIFAGRKT